MICLNVNNTCSEFRCVWMVFIIECPHNLNFNVKPFQAILMPDTRRDQQYYSSWPKYLPLDFWGNLVLLICLHHVTLNHVAGCLFTKDAHECEWPVCSPSGRITRGDSISPQDTRDCSFYTYCLIVLLTDSLELFYSPLSRIEAVSFLTPSPTMFNLTHPA